MSFFLLLALNEDMFLLELCLSTTFLRAVPTNVANLH
ncbi:hypothetical protein Barb6XT_02883 [Bacteroidales bacterium Barb6XT]|nr:hypothetical protein Barb6XT_02883 [Bacteroidales bacterium Barb6XT]